MTFHFGLASLLALRERERDARKARWAEAKRAADVLAEQLENVRREQASLRHEALAAFAPGLVDVDHALYARRQAARLAAEARALEEQRGLVLEEAERRRQALAEAEKQVRVLEKLCEKQAAEHAARESRALQGRLDEAALHGRRRQQLAESGDAS